MIQETQRSNIIKKNKNSETTTRRNDKEAIVFVILCAWFSTVLFCLPASLDASLYVN